jgi:hypothetical protein
MFLRFLQLAVATTLLVAAGGKLVVPGELAGALRASRIFPGRAVPGIGVVVIASEILISIAVLSFQADALSASFGAAAALCSGFVLWGGSVKVRRITLRCACFGGTSTKVTWWTIARAAGLGGLAVMGLFAAIEGVALLEGSAWGAASAVGYSVCVLLLAAFARTRRALLLRAHSMQSASREAEA